MFQLKCEQYWPDLGQEVTHGGISILNASTQIFADFTFRLLNVTCKGKTRKVCINIWICHAENYKKYHIFIVTEISDSLAECIVKVQWSLLRWLAMLASHGMSFQYSGDCPHACIIRDDIYPCWWWRQRQSLKYWLADMADHPRRTSNSNRIFTSQNKIIRIMAGAKQEICLETYLRN
jgi:hypothetical protein